MSDAKTILEKLRDSSPTGAAGRLAALLVEDALGRTLSEHLDVKLAAAAIRDVLRVFTSSDAAAARVVALATEAEDILAAERRPLGALLPAAIKTGAHDLASLPQTPARAVVEKLLDREAFKDVLRAQVIDTLVDFGRKAASPMADSRLARGLGGLSKLAMGQANKPNALGAIANAVSGEVERQVEKRAADFADTAVVGILEGMATQFSDPARAKEQAAVRLALLDGFLELTGAEVAQLGRGAVPQRVAVVREMLAAWVKDASFEADVEALVKTVVGKDFERKLGDVLADFGIRDVVVEKATEAVRKRVAAVVEGEAFAAWVEGVAG